MKIYRVFVGTDNVFVDDVARRVVQAITMELSPGEPSPMILWATNGLPASYQCIEANVNPKKWLVRVPPTWLPFFIWCESWIALYVGGKRLSKALIGFYRSYTHFTTHTWDFQQYSPTSASAISVALVHWVEKFERQLKERNAQKKVGAAAAAGKE